MAMLATGNLISAALSDTGGARDHNEDRVLCDPDRGIFAVVDGMGGHAAGETAAETAVNVLRSRLERATGTAEERLREAIALANNAIYTLAAGAPQFQGMACVLTAALTLDGEVVIGHVGDSRAYLLTPGCIRKLTRDHSPVGERE